MDARLWSHSAKRSARSPPSVIPSCNPAKREGERRKEKRTPIPAMLTIPGPTQTRYFHFHKHQEWNTNTHHPKDSMMPAPHHCRQRRSARSPSSVTPFQSECFTRRDGKRQRDTCQGHTMLALSPHQQTNTEHQESPCSCKAVSLLPAAGGDECTHPFIRRFSIQVGA